MKWGILLTTKLNDSVASNVINGKRIQMLLTGIYRDKND